MEAARNMQKDWLQVCRPMNCSINLDFWTTALLSSVSTLVWCMSEWRWLCHSKHTWKRRSIFGSVHVLLHGVVRENKSHLLWRRWWYRVFPNSQLNQWQTHWPDVRLHCIRRALQSLGLQHTETKIKLQQLPYTSASPFLSSLIPSHSDVVKS